MMNLLLGLTSIAFMMGIAMVCIYAAGWLGRLLRTRTGVHHLSEVAVAAREYSHASDTLGHPYRDVFHDAGALHERVDCYAEILGLDRVVANQKETIDALHRQLMQRAMIPGACFNGEAHDFDRNMHYCRRCGGKAEGA